MHYSLLLSPRKWESILVFLNYPLFFFGIILIFSSNAFAASQTNQLQLLMVDTEINQRSIAQVIDIYVDANQHLWIAQNDLAQMGLIVPKLPTQVIEEKTYIRLDQFPGLHYSLDQSDMRLTITAPVSAFTEQVINNTQDQTENNHALIRPDAPGFFMNYDASAEHTPYDNSPTNTSALTEFGLFNYFGTGSTHELFQNGNENNAHAIRLDTTWTQDQPENLASWRFGDTITSTAPWSGAVRFGGVQYATNFNTQPNLVTFPLPNIRGEAVLPSTVNLLVNNVQNQQTQVNPGPFIINNVPVITGAGNMSVITQDILGREQIVSMPYYSAPQLLKPGLDNFSYESGFIRDNYGVDSNDYGRMVNSATYSKGMNELLTLTGHGELLRDQQTLGSSANYLWRQFGVLSFSVAGSRAASQGTGELAGIGFNRQATPLSYGVKTSFTTRDFTQVGLLPGQLSPISSTQVFTGYDMGRPGSFAATYTYVKARNNDLIENSFAAPSSELVTLSYTKEIFRSSSLTLGAIDDIKNHENNQAFAMITLAMDAVHTANVNTTHQNGEQQYSGSFTKALPVGNGYGYQVYTSHDGVDQSLGSFTDKNDYGQYNGVISRLNNQNNYQVNIQGSVIHFGGVTELSRNFDSGGSFGLVKVPGFDNVRIYDQNQFIGTTDHHGDLFVPNLLPYQKNQIAIDPKDLPMDTKISETEKDVIPYYKSGSLVEFPVKKTYSVIFHLIRSPGDYVPVGSLLKFENNTQDYLVGEQGEVYFDDMQQEKIKGTAYWEDQECRFEIARPMIHDEIPDLGEVICH